MKEKHYLDTLSGKMNELKSAGYSKEYKLSKGQLISYDNSSRIDKGDLVVEDTFRFEGESNPADSAILYKVRCKSTGDKGLISDSYGAESDKDLDDFLDEAEFIR